MATQTQEPKKAPAKTPPQTVVLFLQKNVQAKRFRPINPRNRMPDYTKPVYTIGIDGFEVPEADAKNLLEYNQGLLSKKKGSFQPTKADNLVVINDLLAAEQRKTAELAAKVEQLEADNLKLKEEINALVEANQEIKAAADKKEKQAKAK